VKILIIDDDDVALEVLEHALSQFGYQVTVARNGREGLDLVRSGQFRMVVSDWEMPKMTGIELCREIRRRSASGYVYVILLTSRHGTQSVVDGMNAGADDFVSKPFQPQELVVRIRAGERILSLESRELIIFSMAKLAESRDPETGKHLERMREYCRVIAEHLSQQAKYREEVDGDYVQLIYMTSPLHDIGKVGIPDNILLKAGKLTSEEFEIMKKHAEIGAQTLDATASAHPEAKFLCMARDIARCHHEKFDGSGYPRGLAGTAIPLCGRIVALADVYDALTTKRVYKPAFDHANAVAIIREGRGRHFDPDIVDAFEANEDRFIAICDQLTLREEQEAHANAQRQNELILQ
jgi:putative two-component system response regulator